MGCLGCNWCTLNWRFPNASSILLTLTLFLFGLLKRLVYELKQQKELKLFYPTSKRLLPSSFGTLTLEIVKVCGKSQIFTISLIYLMVLS